LRKKGLNNSNLLIELVNSIHKITLN